MLSFDAARQQFLLNAAALAPAKETLPLVQLQGRVLAESVAATINVPPQDNSAMDGIAFKFSDYPADGIFPISQKIFAGMAAAALKTQTAVRLFTGSIIPEGADTVVLQEDCEFILNDKDELVSVKVLDMPKKGQHIRLAGEDIVKGAEVVAAATVLMPAHIGLLASVGIAEASVYQRLRVALLATGDELVAVGGTLQSGQIYNSNLPMLTAQLQSLGCEVDARHVDDDLALIVENLEQMAADADVVLTIGGVSVGDADWVKTAIEQLGSVQLWKVAMKPGKPVSLGEIKNKAGRVVPLIGLPGNPVSAFATFQLFALPFLQRRMGQHLPENKDECLYPIQLERPRQPKREEFVRVQLVVKNGVPVLKPYAHQGSGVLSSVAWATGFARIPADKPTENGDEVRYYVFT
ncbi:MAG: molybdopterin molybdotransferase MoeA [Pseudomonadales bacterium]|nr:molybdopterin molybdotransferase MoeA [Pseudomonadales bacterium]